MNRLIVSAQVAFGNSFFFFLFLLRMYSRKMHFINMQKCIMVDCIFLNNLHLVLR